MKHLFLDLEDTVITPVVNGWDNTELINRELIKQIVEAFKPDFVHIFSFALHNKHEVEEFKLWVRPSLEAILGMPICVTPDMDEMIEPAVARSLNWHRDTVDFQDIVNLGKQLTFRLYVEDMFKNSSKTPIEVMLVDDTVVDETWEWPDRNIKGTFVRV